MHVWKLVVAAALSAATIPFTVDADACNPYPVGRCGEYDRELVTFCYRVAGGRMIDATDYHVVAVGTQGSSPGVALPDNNARGVLYVRLAPTETFANDPYESDLPFKTVILETNLVRGAQLLPFKCGSFIWYAECDSWMGPYNIQPQGVANFLADHVVV